MLCFHSKEDIKKSIAECGFTLKSFAKEICVGYSTLVNALNGAQPLTPALMHHIALALDAHERKEEERESVFVFKIKRRKVYELHGVPGKHRLAALCELNEYVRAELIKIGVKFVGEREGMILPPLLLEIPAELSAQIRAEQWQRGYVTDIDGTPYKLNEKGELLKQERFNLKLNATPGDDSEQKT